jgi:hypothetical protein
MGRPHKEATEPIEQSKAAQIPAMPQASPNLKFYEDYTTATICTMGFKRSAVRYMLDNEYTHLRARSALCDHVAPPVMGILWNTQTIESAEP